MAINTLGFPMPQAFSGGADFSQLANLGNVMQAQQDRTTKLQALGQLGNDPTQNAMILIKSGDPQLAQHGIDLMNQITQQQRQQQMLQIAQSREQREQQAAEEAEPAYKLQQFQKMFPGQDPQGPEAMAYATGMPQVMKGLPPLIQKRYFDNQASLAPAQDIIDNLDEMKKLSKGAVSGGLLGSAEMKYGGMLPESMQPQAVKNMQNLRTLSTQNILQQVKTLFPGRVLQSEFKTLQMLEKPENYNDQQRQFAYDHLKKLVQTRITELQNENSRIESGNYPGGRYGAPVKAEEETPTETPKPETTMLPPSDWMVRARKVNPGMSDSDLVANWKKKHPNG
jgi:hypothetical protein